jgi:hypothetical protein
MITMSVDHGYSQKCESKCVQMAAPRRPWLPAGQPVSARALGRKDCCQCRCRKLNGLVIKTVDLDQRNPQADSAFVLNALRFIKTVMSIAPKTIVEEVEETTCSATRRLARSPAGTSSSFLKRLRWCALALKRRRGGTIEDGVLDDDTQRISQDESVTVGTWSI